MRSASTTLALAVFFIALTTFFVNGQTPDPKTLKNPVPASPESIKTGQQLYAKYCRFCHGDDAKGNGKMAPKGTMPPDLTDAQWDRGSTDGEIFVVLQEGTPPKLDMKGFKAMIKEPDMWNIVNYLRSIGPQGKSH